MVNGGRANGWRVTWQLAGDIHFDFPTALLGIRVVCGGGFEAGAGEEFAEGFFPACSALSCGDIAVAVDHDIDGVDSGLIHGGEIGVFHHDDLAFAGMLLEIFLDGLLGLAHVDGKKDQSFIGELVAYLVDEDGLVSTEATPSGPKFEEHDLAFDGLVGESFAGSRGGIKAGRGLFVLGAGKDANRGEKQCAGKCHSQREGSRHNLRVI